MSTCRFALCLITALGLSVGSAREAQASSIQFEVKITFYAGAMSQGIPANFNFNVFENPTYSWPGFPGGPTLASGHAYLDPDTVTRFYVSLSGIDLTSLYFSAVGSYNVGPAYAVGAFSAAPPGSMFSDSWVYVYGAQGMSLAGLAPGHPVSGPLINFFGTYRTGSVDGTWEITTVPEPSSIILLAIGLVALTFGRRFLFSDGTTSRS